jgi:hypothetical protein
MEKPTRIEDDLKALTRFTARATRPDVEVHISMRAQVAANTLRDNRLTIDEETVLAIGGPRFLFELQLQLGRYDFTRDLLIPTVALAPHVSTAPERAAYQIRHHSAMDDYPAAFHALERWKVSVRRSDISPELAAWAEAETKDRSRSERIRRHFDLRPISERIEIPPGDPAVVINLPPDGPAAAEALS